MGLWPRLGSTGGAGGAGGGVKVGRQGTLAPLIVPLFPTKTGRVTPKNC